MKLSDLPALGATLDTGIFAGLTTTAAGEHCAVVLLPDRSDKRLTWKKAKAWAEQLEAQLPTRPVSALLFANVKSHVEADWYWTADELDGSYAWHQDFSGGDQGLNHKSYEGRAVAVRLIQLTA
jgi:hypothetical protein